METRKPKIDKDKLEYIKQANEIDQKYKPKLKKDVDDEEA